MANVPTPPAIPGWAQTPPPPVIPPPPSAQPAGWYPDPWAQNAWRWWDGLQWSAHSAAPSSAAATTPAVATTQARKPRLPAWLSPPVLMAGLPSIIAVGFAAVSVPLALVLGLVPLLIVAPVLLLMDRVEPEPKSERLHAFLWGAFVAGFISLIFNTLFAAGTGSEALAAVISAPFIEEITKALGIVWAVRRKQVDGIMDGLVYAGWTALGFAIIEDISYFFAADQEELLMEVFVGRALLTPFAHPLFTAWTGLAIGNAIRQGKPLITAWWGLALAMLSHAAWNGSLSVMEASELGQVIAVIAILGFILLFFATMIAIAVLWRKDRERLLSLAPVLAQRYGIPADRVAALINPKSRRVARKALPKSSRKALDMEAGTIVRLGHRLTRPIHDPVDEARLVSQLAVARGAGTEV